MNRITPRPPRVRLAGFALAPSESHCTYGFPLYSCNACTAAGRSNQNASGEPISLPVGADACTRCIEERRMRIDSRREGVASRRRGRRPGLLVEVVGWLSNWLNYRGWRAGFKKMYQLCTFGALGISCWCSNDFCFTWICLTIIFVYFLWFVILKSQKIGNN